MKISKYSFTVIRSYPAAASKKVKKKRTEKNKSLASSHGCATADASNGAR
jgi:hypothetical protein